MTDLFASTAEYYARYRPGYPAEVFDRIRAAFHLDGTGRLLDLGCGTGEVALRLHADVEEVVGVDPSPEMITEAQRQSAHRGATNVRWLCMPAEDIAADLGRFRLVTIACAFHWMRRDVVLQKSYDLLTPGGGLVILGNPGGIWSGTEPWEQAARTVVQRWLGPARRNLTGAVPQDREEDAVARSPFVNMTRGFHLWQRDVDIDTIAGELYSTSFANKTLLGANAPAFEADLRHTLLALTPTARFTQPLRTEYILAHKP